MKTLGRALRRDRNAAERFPEDVKELQGYLSGKSLVPGVQAIPGHGTNVPIYILGSSLFGASLAAKFGLPYAFASHFAPQHLEAATAYYRENFQPSEAHPEPYVIAGVNVTAGDDAEEEFEKVCFRRVKAFVSRGKQLSDADVARIIDSPQGQQIISMLQYSAVGNVEHVREYLTDFQKLAQADELMISLQSTSHKAALGNMSNLARAWQL